MRVHQFGMVHSNHLSNVPTTRRLECRLRIQVRLYVTALTRSTDFDSGANGHHLRYAVAKVEGVRGCVEPGGTIRAGAAPKALGVDPLLIRASTNLVPSISVPSQPSAQGWF